MTGYVALLRAINLGGSSRVTMNELRAVVETLGYTGVGTLGASGNLLFQGSGSDTTGIERRIEGGLMRALALSTQAFVRTAPEWAAIVRRNPFPTEAIEDPAHLTCWALKEPPDANAWGALRDAIRGPERVAGVGREAYLFYPEGIGRSRVTSALVERTLNTLGTARNWNRVVQIRDRLTHRSE